MRPALRLVLWVAALAVAQLFLVAIGPTVPLPRPDGTSIHEWFDEVGPAGAAMGAIRLVALLLVWYLAATTALGILARLSGLRVPIAMIERISVPLVRRIVTPTVGIAMTVTSLAGTASASGESISSSGPGSPPIAVLVLEVAAPPLASLTMEAVQEPASPSPIKSSTYVDTIVVRPGDHFWSIAAAHAGSDDRQAVTDYWHRLIDANRGRLADPHNPDLLFAGQVLVLPEP